ncbi:hypothetical protein NVS47_03030 [Dehalobacterium formicoaceticum]|uniref:Uncharacterized protein n=1 Tax=Dehalobacterium formicoaceticum TaxID=51515 RepID=A0ABT1Y2W1_9FIRM|nr:hypothetical protein [Dehalobacterium formicoaceticum]MCR6544495.1 hypothetical protein [Dehalobacterium formicoaceticum]
MDYPEEPYDFGGTESRERRMRHYLKIVSDKFHYYLSIDAKYYEIQGTVALSKYQDADSDYVIYDYPAQNRRTMDLGERPEPH